MPRNMKDLPVGSDLSAVHGFAITPADGSDLTYYIRAITLNVGGVLVYDNWEGETCTTAALPAGTYALQARRVRSTSTTATGITGWV